MARRGWLRNEPEPRWTGSEVPPADFSKRPHLAAPAPLLCGKVSWLPEWLAPRSTLMSATCSNWQAMVEATTVFQAPRQVFQLYCLFNLTHTQNLKGSFYYYTHFADPMTLKHTEGKSSSQGHRVWNGKVMYQQIIQLQSPKILLSRPIHWHLLDPWSHNPLTLWKNIWLIITD